MALISDALNMIGDIRNVGGGVSVWGRVLNIPQIVGGLAFITSAEGVIVLVTVLLTLAVAGQIHKTAPFSRLTGMCSRPNMYPNSGIELNSAFPTNLNE